MTYRPHVSSSVVLAFVCACGSDSGTKSAPAGSNRSQPAPDASSVASAADDSSPTNVRSGTPVAQHGALHVASGKIVGIDGAPAPLHGMSLFWSQWGNAFWNASAIASLHGDWKSTIVRAPMGIENGGYLDDPTREKNRVLTIVDAAVAEGIYVIVDWHDHNADQHVAQATTFFAEMAERYRNAPNVIFEVWNEPVDVSWATVKTYAEGIVGTIRSHRAPNLVVVGSPHWSQDVDLAADAPLSDPNVAYAIHFYANTPAHQAPLRAKADAALAKGVALFASEWGTVSSDGNGDVNAIESQKWIDYLKAHDIGWCNWSLFDKPEAASALVPGASPTGPWDGAALTTSGTFVKAALGK